MKKKIVFIANTGFMIHNFRTNLVSSFSPEEYETYVVVPDCDYEESFNKLGARFLRFSLNKSTYNPIKNFIDLVSLYRVLRDVKPDFVFSYTIKCNIYCGLVRYFLAYTFVPNISGLGRTHLSKIWPIFIHIIYKIAFFKAFKILFQNEESRRLLVDKAVVDARQCLVIPGSGIDLNKFKKKEMEFNNARLIKFLYLGRLVLSKGILEFLEAALITVQGNPRVEFHVVGGFDDNMISDKSYKSKFTRYASLDRIVFHGFTRDVRSILEQSHCVCLPSYYPEGVPRSLLEALAVGRMVITTNTPGCKETVIDGENGILLKTGSVHELITAFERVISLDEQTMREAGDRSRKLAENKFSDDLVISTYRNIVGAS